MNPARKYARLALKLIVCAALLFWLCHSIFVNEGQIHIQKTGGDWDDLSRAEQWEVAWNYGPAALWATIRQVSGVAFFGSLLLMGATLGIGTLRWWLALRIQGLHLPVSRTVEISLVAHFFNSFLLGSTGGDLMKAYYAARETRHRKAEAVVTVMTDRLIGLFSMLLFAVLMIIPNREAVFVHDRLALVMIVVTGMFVACTLVARLAFWPRSRSGESGWHSWLRKLPKGDLLDRSLGSCREFGQHPGFLLSALALSMVLNLVCVFQLQVLAAGLELEIPFRALLLIVPSIICISALPITPNGLGVRENLFVLLLASSPFLVNDTKALSLSLLAYAGSLIWSLAGGAVFLTFRESHHYDRMIHNEGDRDS